MVMPESGAQNMREDIHREFLGLLGWQGEELERFLPDWRRTADYLGLTDGDVRYAVAEGIPAHWDLTLAGVRKCIAACIREAAEAAKMGLYRQRGDPVLYSNMPAAPVCMYANKLAGGGRLHISHPDFIMATVLNAFFSKGCGEFSGAPCMNADCRHCGMNRLRADAGRNGRIAPPTITWNWGLHCNEAPKTEEMLRCIQGNEWNDVFITIPHDAPLGDREAEDEDRVDYLASEIRLGQEQVTACTGVAVEQEHLRRAMDEYIAYMRRVEVLTNLVVGADPQPLTGNELTLFGVCMEVSFDIGFSYIDDALDTVIEEVRGRIARGEGVLPKGAPKLACDFNPLNVPWVDGAFRENGVNLTLGRIFQPASSLSDLLGDDDLYRTIARQSLSDPNAVNMRDQVEIVTKLLRRYTINGVLYGFFAFDRWIGALQKTAIQIIEARTNIPHFYLEGDFWDADRYRPEEKMAVIRSICNCLKISGIA